MFDAHDANLLVRKITSGEVVLFLGAGASHNCVNSRGRNVFKGKDLEAEFRNYLSEYSDDLDLGELSDDLIKTSESDFLKILKDQFMDCSPSFEQVQLLKYTWFRCYTLNYDDSILHIPRHERVQKIEPFSRLSKVEEQRGFQELQTIFLNGSINHPNEGFILSAKQYRSAMLSASPWYQKCAEDFANRTFIFIGTELNEPIFEAYIESLQSKFASFSKSFLISPSQASPRKISKLQEYNISFTQGTLKDFTDWLKYNIGDKYSPTDLLSSNGSGIPKTDAEIQVASVVTQIGGSSWLESKAIDFSRKRQLGRDFYSGMAPTWEVITNSIIAELDCIKKVETFLSERASDARGSISIVKGRSGSGKSTATMAALLNLAKHETAKIYEIAEQDSFLVEKAINYIGTLPGPKKILFIKSIHLHIDFIDKFSIACERSGVEVVAQVRSSDWKGRLGRRQALIGHVHDLAALSNRDYDKLATGLSEYAVAPDFRKLDRLQQINFLKSSQRQLLILMLEATKQRAFEEIIEEEYNNLSDDDVKAVFCMVSLITMSRSQLTVGEVESIVDAYGIRQKFTDVLERLEGMIDITANNNLVGRHDLFVRHVIEKAADHNIVCEVIISILESFTIYDVPYVKNAGKVKGNILKYLLRSKFLQEIFGNSHSFVEKVYQGIEFSYQNDGHYWLQRGKYYQSRGRQFEALGYFYRSVEAYDNAFAQHSLAQQKLIVCALVDKPTSRHIQLLNEGVEELERQIEIRDDAEDEYPIVSLSQLHPKVLMIWGRKEEAISTAREYFERLQVFNKTLNYKENSVDAALTYCAYIVTQGALPDEGASKRRIGKHRAYNKK